jgi:hypothetical protein
MASESPNLSTGASTESLSDQELRRLATDLGLDATRYPDRQSLAAALAEHRQLITTFDREPMMELIHWGRRSVPADAGPEELVKEIAAISSMRFAGLSQEALFILAEIRQADPALGDEIPTLIDKLRSREGLMEKFRRKKRAFLGKLVSGLVGEPHSPPPAPTSERPHASIKHEIEESGLLGGITNRIKRTADLYLDQKLDEIEARIDRKLDEIDRRLSEWRDKEIANRLKILKITLWVSVIVAIISLIYAWLKIYFLPK